MIEEVNVLKGIANELEAVYGTSDENIGWSVAYLLGAEQRIEGGYLLTGTGRHYLALARKYLAAARDSGYEVEQHIEKIDEALRIQAGLVLQGRS